MSHPNDTPGDDFDPVACEAELARRRLITLDPEDQEEGFDRFVHVDEVKSVAKERDEANAMHAQTVDTLKEIRDALYTLVPDEYENDNRPLLVRLQRMATEHAEQRALLHRVAMALGQPDQDLADLPDSVDALRRQRDHLQTAAQQALAIGRMP